MSVLLVVALLALGAAGAMAGVGELSRGASVGELVSAPDDGRSAAAKEYCKNDDRNAGSKQYGGCGCKTGNRHAAGREYGCPDPPGHEDKPDKPHKPKKPANDKRR